MIINKSTLSCVLLFDQQPKVRPFETLLFVRICAGIDQELLILPVLRNYLCNAENEKKDKYNV